MLIYFRADWLIYVKLVIQLYIGTLGTVIIWKMLQCGVNKLYGPTVAMYLFCMWLYFELLCLS